MLIEEGTEADALPGGGTVSVMNGIRMNTMALDTRMMSGGSSTTGCLRAAAAPLSKVVRTRSAATARIMARAVRAGP